MQGDREGHLLDRERGGDADALEGVGDLGQDPELSEGGQDLACSRWVHVQASEPCSRGSSRGRARDRAASCARRRYAASLSVGCPHDGTAGRTPARRRAASSDRYGGRPLIRAAAGRVRRPRLPGRRGRPARGDRLRRDLGVRAAQPRTPSWPRRWRDKAELAPDGRAPSSRTSSGCSDRLAELGADPFEAMAPFVRRRSTPSTARTAPADWLEGLVKAYVGDGLAADFYREIAAFLDADTRDAHRGEPRRTPGSREFVVDRVRAAIAADPRVGGRLALWGRRLMGEALSPGAAGRRRAGRADRAARRRGRPARHGPGRDRPDVHPADREPHRSAWSAGARRLSGRRCEPPGGASAKPTCAAGAGGRARRRRACRPGPRRGGPWRRSASSTPRRRRARSVTVVLGISSADSE